VSDIVDRIDELVDASLSVGPVDDYNADRYDRCPHCSRHWHGLPVTERIAGMYYSGRFDEDYRADEDDTRILCHGSDFIGPMPAERPAWGNKRRRVTAEIGPGSPRWLQGLIADTENYVASMMEAMGLPAGYWYLGSRRNRWWKLTLPDDAEIVQQITDSEPPETTLVVGDQSETWPTENVHINHLDVPDEIRPETIVRVVPRRVELHVLTDVAPHVGGTWEPMTAPGVTTHPSRGLTRVGPNPWDFEYTPVEGQTVSFAANGRVLTGRISRVEHPSDCETVMTVRQDSDGPGWLALNEENP